MAYVVAGNLAEQPVPVQGFRSTVQALFAATEVPYVQVGNGLTFVAHLPPHTASLRNDCFISENVLQVPADLDQVM